MSFINVKSDWRLIRERWNALGGELQLLDTVALSDTDFKNLARWREHPKDKKTYEKLPLVVANWRAAAVEEVGRKASACRAVMDEDAKDPSSVLCRFARDVALIDAVLFGTHEKTKMEVRGQIGPFDSIEYGSQSLHVDAYGYPRLYLSRLFALPTLAIDRQRLCDLGPLQKMRAHWLIYRAYKISADPKFKKKLRRMKILMPLPLGAVSLLAVCHGDCREESATRHCASELPMRNDVIVPTNSALYKAGMA